MRNNNSKLITNIIVFIAGLLLIILHDRVNIMEEIIVIIGVMFIIPSVLSLVLLLFIDRNHDNGNTLYPTIIPTIGGITLGLFLIITPNLFVGFLAYLFAGLLLFGGIYHIMFLALAIKKVKMPLWFYILPSLMIIAGLVIIFTDIRTIESIIVLVTGIFMIFFAISSFLEYLGMRAVRRSREIG